MSLSFRYLSQNIYIHDMEDVETLVGIINEAISQLKESQFEEKERLENEIDALKAEISDLKNHISALESED